MDAVTLYVVLMTAAGERRVLHETVHPTMNQCLAVGAHMKVRRWDVSARGSRVLVRCQRSGVPLAD